MDEDTFHRPKWHESYTDGEDILSHERPGRIARVLSQLKNAISKAIGEPDQNVPSFLSLIANGADAIDSAPIQPVVRPDDPTHNK